MSSFQRKAPLKAAGYRRSAAVTIRWATPDDGPGLAILAALDEAEVPESPVLLAFVGDELWVAMSLATGAIVSDPFRPSKDLAALVLERGRQLTVPELGRPRTGLKRLRSRFTTARRFDSLPRLGREAT
jgi:hypothetical protein